MFVWQVQESTSIIKHQVTSVAEDCSSSIHMMMLSDECSKDETTQKLVSSDNAQCQLSTVLTSYCTVQPLQYSGGLSATTTSTSLMLYVLSSRPHCTQRLTPLITTLNYSIVTLVWNARGSVLSWFKLYLFHCFRVKCDIHFSPFYTCLCGDLVLGFCSLSYTHVQSQSQYGIWIAPLTILESGAEHNKMT